MSSSLHEYIIAHSCIYKVYSLKPVYLSIHSWLDYIANWENFTFSAANTTQIFRVHIIDDLIPEPDETFTVNVSSLDDNCIAGTPAMYVLNVQSNLADTVLGV